MNNPPVIADMHTDIRFVKLSRLSATHCLIIGARCTAMHSHTTLIGVGLTSTSEGDLIFGVAENRICRSNGKWSSVGSPFKALHVAISQLRKHTRFGRLGSVALLLKLIATR